jgi:hypothetical protein
MGIGVAHGVSPAEQALASAHDRSAADGIVLASDDDAVDFRGNSIDGISSTPSAARTRRPGISCISVSASSRPY